MSKEFQHEDNLDYNDGLGDLLRGKERREFSWTKTALVMTLVVFIVFIVLVAVFSIGKSFFMNSAQKEPAIPDAILRDIEKIEKEMDAPSANQTVHTSASSVAPLAQIKEKASIAPVPKVEQVKPVVAAVPVTPKVQPEKKKTSKISRAHIKKVVTPKVSSTKPTVGVNHAASPYKLIVQVCDTKEQAKALQKMLAAKKIDTYCWISSDKPAKYYVQAGAFSSSAEAEKSILSLKTKGFSPFVQKK